MAAGAAPDDPEGCRAWYGAAPPASRLPAAPLRGGLRLKPDPGSLCAPEAAGNQGQAKACPRLAHGTPHPSAPRIVTTERVINRHCCDNPLSPPSTRE